MSDLSPGATRATYSARHFEPLFAAEDRHFWFRSRNRCIAAASRLIPDPGLVKDIIEHGCGTGFVLAELQRLFPAARVVGADLFAEGLAFARRRFAGTLIQTDLLNCGFREAFDLIGLFDVLEHLDDDLRILRALGEQLRPGGHLLLTVPAHRVLWSRFDIDAGHRRRYSRRELIARLAAAGFRVDYCTEFMSVLFPLMLVRRRLAWGRTDKGQSTAEASAQVESELHINPLLNGALELALRPEAWCIRRGWRIPAGTSLLALATRNE